MDPETENRQDIVFRALRLGASIDEIAHMMEATAPEPKGEVATSSATPPPWSQFADGEQDALRTVHGEVIEGCSMCGCFDVVFEHGFIHCRKCDHSETAAVFDYEYDYRSFPDNKDTSRCMAPRVKLHVPQLMIIGNGRSTLERMHRSYCSTYHDKTLDSMCKNLESLAKGAHIQQRIIDQASGYVYQIFKKDSDGTLFRGKNRDGLLAACLYYAMKHNVHAFRNLQEVADILKIDDVRYVHRGVEIFAKILESAASVTQFYEDTPEVFVKRWVSTLVFENPKMHKAHPTLFDEAFTKNLADRLIYYISELPKHRYFSNKPETLTAGCMWWILTQIPDLLKITGLTREDLAPICHVSESTIGQMAKEIGRVFVVEK